MALESAGIPTVGLYSSAFSRQAAFQAAKLGLTEVPPCVYVAHPISDQTPSQLQAKASAAFDAVVAALVNAEYASAPAVHDVSAPAVDPEADSA